MNFTERSCKDFVAELSDKAPVPGGGAATALVGSMGVALGNMVGNLTVGKKKYAGVEGEIKNLMDRAAKLEQELLVLVERDAEVFAPLAEAYRMPKDTDEEKAEKERVMAVVLKDACEVPLQIMEKCCEAIELHGEFAEKGSALAVSDAGVGVIFCKSALQGAALNVFINTDIMADREYAERENARADEMLREYTVKADRVYASVFSKLRK